MAASNLNLRFASTTFGTFYHLHCLNQINLGSLSHPYSELLIIYYILYYICSTYFPNSPTLIHIFKQPQSTAPPSSSSSTFSQHSASSWASWACNGCPTSMSRSRQKAEDSCGKICKAVSGGTWSGGMRVNPFGHGRWRSRSNWYI